MTASYATHSCEPCILCKHMIWIIRASTLWKVTLAQINLWCWCFCLILGCLYAKVSNCWTWQAWPATIFVHFLLSYWSSVSLFFPLLKVGWWSLLSCWIPLTAFQIFDKVGSVCTCFLTFLWRAGVWCCFVWHCADSLPRILLKSFAVYLTKGSQKCLGEHL